MAGPLVAYEPKWGLGKLRRSAREVHLCQVDGKRPTRGCGASKEQIHHTSTRSRLYAQVEFRREMRPIACVDPGAFFVDNLGQLSKKPTLGQSPAIQAGALR
jgi:hypothetical protein